MLNHPLYHLHMAPFYVCCVVSLVVFAVLMGSLIKFRQAKGSHFHKYFVVEVVWTVLPFLILLALAMPVTVVLKDIHTSASSSLKSEMRNDQNRAI